MALPSSATVTGATGPGLTLTTGAFTGVTNIQFIIPDNTLRLACDQGIVYISLSGSNTITMTASSGAYTLTIS